MTTSASTPRLRITQTWYLVLLLLSAFGSHSLAGPLSDLLLSAAAIVLVCGAFLGRIWCSAFIAGRKDETLVTSGPYSLCRHPLYGLSWLAGVGLGLATRSITLTVVTAFLLATLLWRASLAEEQLLTQLHGAEFSAYAAITPRFLPRRWSAALPATINVMPEIFLKSFRDSRAMLGLYLLISTARSLHDLGVLPTVVYLP